jgi:hypothetical protein
MDCRPGWVIPTLLVTTIAAAAGDYESVARKFDSIEANGLPPGSRVVLTYRELSAWAEHEVPEGVRNPRIELTGPRTVTGSALVDFGKVSRAEGHPPGWLMAKLLEGERPVSVTVRIASSGGQARVDVERVAISGLVVDGATLDFLIRNVLLPLYPNAVVGRPFSLGHRIERLDPGPHSVGVAIGP